MAEVGIFYFLHQFNIKYHHMHYMAQRIPK
jgi:hypothetical protein